MFIDIQELRTPHKLHHRRRRHFVLKDIMTRNLPMPMPSMGVGAPLRSVISGMPNQYMLPNALQMPTVQQPEKRPTAPNKPIQVWEGTLNNKGTANGDTQDLCVHATASTAVPNLAYVIQDAFLPKNLGSFSCFTTQAIPKRGQKTCTLRLLQRPTFPWLRFENG